MKRYAAAAVFAAVFVVGAVSAAAVAGKSPASLVSSHTTTTGTTTVTTGTTGTTTVPTTTQPPQAKVTICHHTGSKSNPHRTIRVSSRAVPAHLRHGDTLGPCPTTQNVAKHSRAAHVKKFHKGKTLRAELRAEKQRAQKAKGRGKGRR